MSGFMADVRNEHAKKNSHKSLMICSLHVHSGQNHRELYHMQGAKAFPAYKAPKADFKASFETI
jgi:hypothetical protein